MCSDASPHMFIGHRYLIQALTSFCYLSKKIKPPDFLLGKRGYDNEIEHSSECSSILTFCLFEFNKIIFLSFTEVDMKSCPSNFRSLNDLLVRYSFRTLLWSLGESIDSITGASAKKVSENFFCS